MRDAKNGINEDVTIHRLYGAVNINGTLHRVKITVKEDVSSERKKAYNYEVTKIELPNSDDATNQSTGLKVLNTSSESNSIPTANLLKGVEKSYDKGVNILDDHTKVIVPETGELMVMYHGTQSGVFTKFYTDGRGKTVKVYRAMQMQNTQ